MFKWFRRSNNDNSTKLHGVNLDTWDYLGYTKISYANIQGKTEVTGIVFGFVNKENKKRMYKVLGSTAHHCFNTHNWTLIEAELWKIGERDIWAIAKTEPSQSLKTYMKVTRNLDWDWDKDDWVEHKVKPIVHMEDDSNVVRLEFKTDKADLNS